MQGSAWDDLREDARTFSRQNPETGHTLVFVPDRSAEGVSRIDVDPGDSDFSAVIAGGFNTDRPLRELGVGGIESRIRHRTQFEIGESAGFVGEWLWCDPVGGTIHPKDEPENAWPRLCAALWRLIVDRVGVLIPKAIKTDETDAPTIGTDPDRPDAARLLHWLAWSGRVDGLRAKVRWRLSFRPTDDSQLAEFPTSPTTITQDSPFSTGRPERPTSVPSKPWLQLAGWWWSTIEPTGAALVAAIDWLRTADAAERLQAGLPAAGAMAGGVISDTTTLPVDPHVGKGDAKPDDLDDEGPPALTANQILVIATMARFDGSRLLSAARIEEEMDAAERLSKETVRKTVARLIKLELAERPEGPRNGARLTMKGRRLVPKIAD